MIVVIRPMRRKRRGKDMQKVYICTQCKKYWIEPKPKYCKCGLASMWLHKTHHDNAKLAENKKEEG